MHLFIKVLEIVGAAIGIVAVLGVLVLIRLTKHWETGE